MEEINKLIEAIKNSKNIVIFSHISPDGDTLGSMLALKGMIEQLGTAEKIDAINTGKLPDIYHFLPGINSTKNSYDRSLYQSYDLAIAVDCASMDRLGDSLDSFRNAKITANIDHHVSNTKFAEINLVDSQASATGEFL